MKERVYGWYPAAQDIYISNRQPPSYEKECLYRHWKSTYSHRPGSKNSDSPGTPTSVKLSLSPRPQRRSASPSRAEPCRPHTVSAIPHRPDSDSRAESRIFSPDEHRPATEQGARSRPASVHVRYKTPTPTPKKAWSMKVPETPVTFTPKPPSAKCSLPPGHECDNLNIRTPDAKPDRVRSATYERPRSTLPPRPVKSAGTTRSPYISYCHDGGGSERPRAPVPSSTYPYEDSTLDYDEQLEKHGWRMEVPGDPLNLKRPCIVKRLPVTYKVKIPTVPPNPPRAKATNYETFFYNTIPRKPATFTIHQEWVSEVLHAKRMELQKREGYKYRTTDFGFVY